ncbi:MAG: Dabb family protein [Hydrogenophaga sp.]|uniref:Dabb family protein n=1 Tax=Hydrogenophaga sp. TaxID=1904254 RepID=UPI001D5F7821|nr:Dabb family protein [Hydrogenophaga sp.]MBX3611415.1 Dabb family protein [Hydrogenophaga sp.]
MLRHIVMWKLKEHAEGADRVANRLKAKALLEACARLDPGTLHFQVGIAQEGLECTYDVVLDSTFVDREAMAAYQQHPQHVALKPFMKAIVAERQCMDFEI